ncbi:MAG TPA: hypothetical protein VKG44_10060 [Candidatus Baltobacteraceae bacterium]|nr:hypothetical protein [Candidatus Baltobacteraceae bacterium]
MPSIIDTTSSAPPRHSAALAIGYGGLLAGVLDILFAIFVYVFVFHTNTAVGVLQYIASGVLGSAAFSGGFGSAALGLVLHFLIAFALAAIYYFAATRVIALRMYWAPAGLVYGVLVWLVMSFVVVPISATPKAPFDASVFWTFLVGHAFFVGLPISWAVHRFT